jgi:hypothetical protein
VTCGSVWVISGWLVDDVENWLLSIIWGFWRGLDVDLRVIIEQWLNCQCQLDYGIIN